MADEDQEMPLPEKTDHVQVMYPSRYLKKEDLHGKDVTLTIAKVALRNVRMTNGSRERKVIVHFEEMVNRDEEHSKVWVLPKTNALAIAELYAEPNPHKWKGLRVTLYNDEGVTFAGKRVGGIRVRPRKPEKGGK